MDFIVKNRTIVTYIAFTLFCIISLSVRNSGFSISIEGVGSALTMPFQKIYDGVENNVHKLWAGFTELSRVRDELQKTRLKLQKFESMTEDLSEIKRENDRLRHLLSLKERVGFDSIPAEIISKDPDNWFRTLIINRGKNDGIKINMPVIAFSGDEKAIVGKVVEVRGSISRVLPIISTEMKVGVRFQENRYPGLLYGYSPNSNLCVADYVSRAAVLKSGDLVITSGQGGIFPSGIAAAKVIKAEILESSSYQRIIVKPIIDFDLLEDVFVVKMQPDKEMLEISEGLE